jgi:hypothetical protein
MKPRFLLPSLAVTFAAIPAAQTADVGSVAPRSQLVLTDRGPHHRTFERTDLQQTASGVRPRKLRYVELATGMHYKQTPSGPWLETREEIVLLPDGLGAAATNGPLKAWFPANIYKGAIVCEAADGVRITSRPYGVSYADGTNSVLIAELKESVAQLLPAGNCIVYPDCMTRTA